MDTSSQIELPGHVENGVVVLEGGASLPEGTQVRVRYAGKLTIHVSPIRKPVELPLIKTGEPGSLDLTNDRIAEILAEEEIESLKSQWNAPS